MAPRLTGLTKLTLETAPTRLPRVHLVADPRAPGGRQGPLDREGRGRVRRVRHRLLRLGRAGARLDAVRAGGSVPARYELPGGPRERRRDARHVRLPRRRRRAPGCCSRSSSPRSARRATAARAASRRSRIATPRASPSYERFRVHQTVFPQDFLADFGFEVVRAAGRVGLSRLELGGLAAGRGGRAREGAAGREGRIRRPRAGAARRGRDMISRRRRVRGRARAPRSGSRSALRPCAGCRSRGRARDRARPSGRGGSGRRARRRSPRALPGEGNSSTRTDGAAASSSRARSAESSSSNSTQIASAWPTITGTRTHVAWIGSSGSSMIFRVSSRSFDSSSNSSPSKSQSMRRSCSSCGSLRSRSIDCAPAPETDWYVATRTRTSPAASCSGFRTQVSGIVQQFGLATMPSCSSARTGFTSGTTSGMPGSSR